MSRIFYTAHAYQSSWVKHFRDNMEDVGFPAPQTIYQTAGIVFATADIIDTNIKTFGANATVTEQLFATTKLEKTRLTSRYLSLFYLGAIIGSAAVATGKVLGEDPRFADIYLLIHHKKYSFTNAQIFYQNHREIIITDAPNRRWYEFKARVR